MKRDYSHFLSSKKTTAKTKTGLVAGLSPLEKLGWNRHFAEQPPLPGGEETPSVRITEVHRAGLRVLGDGINELIPPRADATVGDWLLFNSANPKDSILLERKSLFKRRAPGTDRQVQLIAANIDTVFVVSSCNHDFNVARLERYIALAFEAQVDPVIVLTKSDLSDDPTAYEKQAWALSDTMAGTVPVVVLDARGTDPAEKLAPWCRPGQTLAFMGSSGVGKSTLVNALSDEQAVETQAIREDDSKGRHTTTSRQLHVLPSGYLLLDTPGMRELQMTDTADGIADVFADLHSLSYGCKFKDCQHDTEPGCAVLAAVANGTVASERLKRWRKLVAEEQYNSSTLAERRSKDKAFGKIVREAMKIKKR